MATLATLLVLDDLTFGPAFWFVARVWGAVPAVIAVYVVYVTAQIYLVRRATTTDPGRLASFLLGRLDLDRRSRRIGENEERLHARVAGGLSAVFMTLLIGGVLPCLLLWRGGYSTEFVRRLSIVTSVVYATEFMLLHAVIPSTI